MNAESEIETELPWDLIGPTTVGLSIGIVLQGTYRIIRQLAEGGCGEIYLAAHTRLPGRFAVKLLHRSLAQDSDALTRFRQEAEITSSLRHPHIVQVFDFNITDNGVPFLVMELLEGKLLSQRIAGAGALEPAVALHIIDQIANALQAAHERGVVHRDLKPDNVMLLSGAGVEDFVKVLDFGISQASWRPRLTEGERVAGTPQFMAPEQACGLRDQIDHRSDQFSLAAIAYTLLTGQEPFRGENPIAVLYEVVHHEPAPPSQIVPALSPEIEAVIMRGLAKESADRYPNVIAFAGALRIAIHGTAAAPFAEPISEPPPVRTPTPIVERPAVRTPPPLVVAPPAVRTPAPVVVVPPAAAAPPFDLAFPAVADPIDLVVPVKPPGHDTVRLIRRMRWRLNKTPRRLLLVGLAAAALCAWLSPVTRGPTRSAWHRAASQVRIMLERVLPNFDRRP